MRYSHEVCTDEMNEECSKLGHKDIGRDYEKTRCKFCDELKGIMIYIDKNAKKSMMIGWAHLCCIYWHPFLEFVD